MRLGDRDMARPLELVPGLLTGLSSVPAAITRTIALLTCTETGLSWGMSAGAALPAAEGMWGAWGRNLESIFGKSARKGSVPWRRLRSGSGRVGGPFGGESFPPSPAPFCGENPLLSVGVGCFQASNLQEQYEEL